MIDHCKIFFGQRGFCGNSWQLPTLLAFQGRQADIDTPGWKVVSLPPWKTHGCLAMMPSSFVHTSTVVSGGYFKTSISGIPWDVRFTPQSDWNPHIFKGNFGGSKGGHTIFPEPSAEKSCCPTLNKFNLEKSWRFYSWALLLPDACLLDCHQMLNRRLEDYKSKITGVLLAPSFGPWHLFLLHSCHSKGQQISGHAPSLLPPQLSAAVRICFFHLQGLTAWTFDHPEKNADRQNRRKRFFKRLGNLVILKSPQARRVWTWMRTLQRHLRRSGMHIVAQLLLIAHLYNPWHAYRRCLFENNTAMFRLRNRPR